MTATAAEPSTGATATAGEPSTGVTATAGTTESAAEPTGATATAGEPTGLSTTPGESTALTATADPESTAHPQGTGHLQGLKNPRDNFNVSFICCFYLNGLSFHCVPALLSCAVKFITVETVKSK